MLSLTYVLWDALQYSYFYCDISLWIVFLILYDTQFCLVVSVFGLLHHLVFLCILGFVFYLGGLQYCWIVFASLLCLRVIFCLQVVSHIFTQLLKLVFFIFMQLFFWWTYLLEWLFIVYHMVVMVHYFLCLFCCEFFRLSTQFVSFVLHFCI